ncbi:MAG: orotate phosphoribosyltransferase [Nitrospira sp.]|nr:orotate phosphoribosyltransferase [Nitrospira sp.]
MIAPIQKLIDHLLKTSFHYSDVPKYTLASGQLSQYYIDCRMALSYAEVRRLAGELILGKLGDIKVQAVGGMMIGAYPVAIAVSDAADRKRMQIPIFIVRKDPKVHGMKKYIEGAVEPGMKVLVVDDVVTSGKSIVDAINRCRDEGLRVVKSIALIDRQEQQGRENIERIGVSFDALLTLKDLLHAYQSKG